MSVDTADQAMADKWHDLNDQLAAIEKGCEPTRADLEKLSGQIETLRLKKEPLLRKLNEAQKDVPKLTEQRTKISNYFRANSTAPTVRIPPRSTPK